MPIRTDVVRCGLLAQMGADGGGMGGGGMMMVAMIVFAVLLVAGLGLLVRALIRGRGDDGADPEDPLRVLERRLARGEISTDEYYERRSALGDGAR